MNFWERYNDCVGKGERNGNSNAGGRSAYGANNASVNSGNVNNGSNGQNTTSQNRQSDRAYSEQDVRRKFDEYSGKNEGELMGELASTVARMKSEGSFDAQAIENMYNTAAPFLNDMQRQRMREIIDTLVK